jgi:hypothetical protein
MPTTAATSNLKTDKLALRRLQTQDWLALPQGYIVGSKTQDTEGGKEKKKDGEAVLKKYLKDAEGKVNCGEQKQEGGWVDRGEKSGGGSGREELLCVGAWTEG